MTTIENDLVVQLQYTLKNSKGEKLDSSDGKDPFIYLHGKKNIIPGLEKGLDGKKVGSTFTVVVEPKEAYGERNENLSVSKKRTIWPKCK
jgi:FKBP-type peptidyl-prolyl cis-trans isomerase SlyD